MYAVKPTLPEKKTVTTKQCSKRPLLRRLLLMQSER